MTDTSTDLMATQRRDEWRTRRIWIAGAFGLWLGGSRWVFDFWPLAAGSSQSIRAFIDLSRLLFIPPLAILCIVLLIAATLALCRGFFRRALSNILAVSLIPICFLLASKNYLFDPWLWYATINKNKFYHIAAKHPEDKPAFIVLENEDVSTGIAGLTPNHFVFLIYDETDAIGLDPSERPAGWKTRNIPVFNTPFPRGRRLYGHIFRVDDFE